MTDGRDDVRFAVLVVLFGPSDAIVDGVVEMASTAPLVVAVDNTPVADAAVHERLAGAGVTVVANGNRGGLAGAYNVGAAEALRLAADAVFFLDQDSTIGPTFFADMLRPVRHELDRAFVVGATVHEVRMDITMPAFPPERDLRDGGLDDPALAPAAFVVSSGSLMSRAALERLREFREDYFIEWLDVEVSLRAQREGVPVLMNEVVVLHQMTGDITRHGKHFTTNHPAWRKYYRVRNMGLVSREYGFGRGGPVGVLLRGLMEAGVVLRFEHGRPRKVVAILAGLLDGLLGRAGLFEDRHPRVQRYCTSAPHR